MISNFENPNTFKGQGGDVVLIYKEYIIWEITQSIADLCVEKITKEIFDDSDFTSLIKVKDVFEYEFEPGHDSYITFGIAKNDGTSYVRVDFQNVYVTKEAEKSFQEHFKQLGFKRQEKQLTALEAALSPGIVTAFIAGVGSLLTWFAYGLQDYEAQRTRVVRWYVYLFEKTAKFVGYFPFLIITVVLTIICLYWLIKRMLNPPSKILSVK